MKDATSNSAAKKQAALYAASLVEDGMFVGLGTGSTAAFVIEELGRRIKEEGLRIRSVVTSRSSFILARKHGISAEPLEFTDHLDISIDGADEIDPRLCLIKGGGAAHTIEKLVHSMSDSFVVVADESKMRSHLGESFPVPVEILAPSLSYVSRKLMELGAAEMHLRTGSGKDGPVLTDNGNPVLDVRMKVSDPERTERLIKEITGVVESGIFSPFSVKVHQVIIGTSEENPRILCS